MGIDAIIAAVVAIGVPLGIAGHVLFSERLVRPFGKQVRSRVRPWLWLLPALVLMGTMLFYPLLATARLSLSSADGTEFVGLRNYTWAFNSPDVLEALGTSLLWIVVLPVVVLVLALVVAVLADRVSYEGLAKSIVMIPSALSLVVGGVVWSLVYRYTPPNATPIGLANALWMAITGNDPIAWTVDTRINDFALMLVGLWTWLGFATVLLSAGVKGVSAEHVEAARIDGANEWQVFRHITLPSLSSTLIVVLTTLVVWTLKVFDIIYVLTTGRYGTDVLATQVYKELFIVQDIGQGSALAIILFLIAIPVMAVNVASIRRGERP